MQGRQEILDEAYIGTVSLKLSQSDKADKVIYSLKLKWDVFGVNLFSRIVWQHWRTTSTLR